MPSLWKSPIASYPNISRMGVWSASFGLFDRMYRRVVEEAGGVIRKFNQDHIYGELGSPQVKQGWRWKSCEPSNSWRYLNRNQGKSRGNSSFAAPIWSACPADFALNQESLGHLIWIPWTQVDSYICKPWSNFSRCWHGLPIERNGWWLKHVKTVQNPHS